MLADLGEQLLTTVNSFRGLDTFSDAVDLVTSERGTNLGARHVSRGLRLVRLLNAQDSHLFRALEQRQRIENRPR